MLNVGLAAHFATGENFANLSNQEQAPFMYFYMHKYHTH